MPRRRMSRQKSRDVLFRTLEPNMHGIALCSAEPDGPRIDFVGRVTEMTGWAREDFLVATVSWSDLLQPDEREGCLRELSALKQTGQNSVSFEYRLVARDASILCVTDRSAVRMLWDGTNVLEGIARDST
jgi:PAS domain-containing protein